MRFSIDTLGCKVNQSESDFIARNLIKKGMEPVRWQDSPDFCIINTCTVTSQSDRKTRQLIRRIKLRNNSSKIIVTGCFIAYNREFLNNCGADFIVENKNKHKIIKLIVEMSVDGKGKENINPDTCSHSGFLRSRPMVKIQDGCEQNCSYCIVPKVRGKYRSVPQEEVLNNIITLQKDGFEEIVLTGVHIGKYGVDLGISNLDSDKRNACLADLLEEITERTGIKRIRISSIEVNEINSGILEVLEKKSKRFARHLHIPLQSGSDRILELMRRPYTAGYYIKKIGMLKKNFPGIALTTDVIAGFPGESRKDFMQTVKVIKRAAFSKIHVFKFSGRIHTAAYMMNGQIDEKVKSERSRILRDAGDKLRNTYFKNNMGKCLNVVCEEMYDRNNLAGGTSGNYIKVYFSLGGKDFSLLKGKILKVSTNSLYKNGLEGALS